MRVLIQHRSRYLYPSPALLGPQVIRLRPTDHTRARIESYALTIAPEHRVHWQRDPHGNHVARVTFKAGQRVSALDLTVELTADIAPVNPFDFFLDDRAKQVHLCDPQRLVRRPVDLGADDPLRKADRRGEAPEELITISAAGRVHNDVDVLVGSLISILEPLMVVVLGLIVGFIVIALFAPMISLIQTVSSPKK